MFRKLNVNANNMIKMKRYGMEVFRENIK